MEAGLSAQRDTEEYVASWSVATAWSSITDVAALNQKTNSGWLSIASNTFGAFLERIACVLQSTTEPVSWYAVLAGGVVVHLKGDAIELVGQG